MPPRMPSGSVVQLADVTVRGQLPTGDTPLTWTAAAAEMHIMWH